MTKKTSTRQSARQKAGFSSLPEFPELRVEKTRGKEFKPLNKAQLSYFNKIHNNTLTFGLGSAGVGKTFVAAGAAASMLKNKQIEKIILVRPMVEAGEEMGFLPGDLHEKYTPYIAPLVDALAYFLGKGYVDALIEHEKIVFLPLAFMRGHSLGNSFVILDEAQNCTRAQMKLFLTRLANDSVCVVDGDLSQKDLKVDGLDDALFRLDGVPSVAVENFSDSDIVRSGFCKEVVLAYSNKKDNNEDKGGLYNYLGK